MHFPDDVPRLTDGTVTLRAHRDDDIDAVLAQCQDPEMQRWVPIPVPYSRSDAEAFVTEMVPAGWGERSFTFAVEAPGPGDADGAPRFVGSVSLRVAGDGAAEVGFAAATWARGQGVMERAMRLLLDWGFASFDLQQIMWRAVHGNWSSRKLAWRLGFSFDGTVRRWLPHRGELLDAWVGTLLAGEPMQPRSVWYDVPRIVGASVVLRAHHDSDAERIVEAATDERSGYWLRLPRPYTLDTARQYVEGRRESHATGTGLHWAVADPGTDDLIANISLFDLKPGDSAEIGYWTHPAARGRGVMTQACGLVVRHAFVSERDDGLGLRRVAIFSAVGNTGSRRVIEANGFVEVGRPRADIALGDGTWTDSVAYDMLSDDYLAALRRH